MAQSKFVTVIIVPDGTDAKSGFRIRQWLLKLIIGSIGFLLVGILLFFSFYGGILSRAARTDELEKENTELRRYRYKVGMLEENLKEARDVVGRLAEMAGIDYDFPELPSDSMLFAQLDLPIATVVRSSTSEDWTMPEGLPIQGFVTQDFEIVDESKYHPGVDIACAIGTPVLATGSGVVQHIGVDSVYGNMVVIKHSDSVTTLYGHNDRILVKEGTHVQVGGRIALSGNSGQSSAPHLHYEIRINDEPINPIGKKK